MPHFFRGRTLSMQMVDHLFIDVTLLKRPIVYLESGRPLQTTTAEGVDMLLSRDISTSSSFSLRRLFSATISM